MIDNMDNINNLLENIAKILGVLVVLLPLLAKLFKELRPAIKFIAFLATQIIPNGLIVWIWLYVAAVNANRLIEPATFLSLIGQETALLVAYNLVWGIWIYPKIKYLLAKEKPKEGEADAKKTAKRKKE